MSVRSSSVVTADRCCRPLRGRRIVERAAIGKAALAALPVVVLCNCASAVAQSSTKDGTLSRISSVPHVDVTSLDVRAINARLPVGSRVVNIRRPLTEADFAVPPQFAERAEDWERLPTGKPIVIIETLSKEAMAAGAANTTVTSGATAGDA